MVSLLNIAVLGLASSHAVTAFALFPWFASYINSANTLDGTSTTAPIFPTAAAFAATVNGTGSYQVSNSTTYLSPTNGSSLTNQTSVPYLHNWNATLVASSVSESSSVPLTSGSLAAEETSIEPSLTSEAAGQTTDGSVAPTDVPTDSTADAAGSDDITTTLSVVYTLTNSYSQPVTTTITAVETLTGAGSALAAASTDEDITTFITIIQTITASDLSEPITTTVEIAQTITNTGASLADEEKAATTSSDDIITTTMEAVQTLTNSNSDTTTTTIQIVQTITDTSSPEATTVATAETSTDGDEETTTSTLELSQTRYWNTSSVDDHTTSALSKYSQYNNSTQATYTLLTQSSATDDSTLTFILSSA